MKKGWMVLAVLVVAQVVGAQTWYPANQATLVWDAAAKVATTDQANKYQCWTKYGSATATPVKAGTEITATQQTLTFSTEGRYFLCVQTIRYPQNETVGIPSARMACTDIAADVQGGSPFGIVYYVPPSAPGALRQTVP